MSLTSNITTTSAFLSTSILQGSCHNCSAVPQQFGVSLPDRDLSPLIRTTLSYLSNINRLELLTSEIGAEQVTSLKVMYETGMEPEYVCAISLVSDAICVG